MSYNGRAIKHDLDDLKAYYSSNPYSIDEPARERFIQGDAYKRMLDLELRMRTHKMMMNFIDSPLPMPKLTSMFENVYLGIEQIDMDPKGFNEKEI